MSVATQRTGFTFSPMRNTFQHSELDKYFEIQRCENEAAKVIQKSWRRTRVLLPWRRAVYAQKKVTLIQKIIRGILARKWVAEWYSVRNQIVINWQAHARRFVINKHTRIALAKDQVMAIRIQRIIRGKLARLRCTQLLYDMAATRVQVLWRGVVARAHCDKMWLFKHTVVPIQKVFRKSLAVKRINAIKDEYNTAALKIQRIYRKYMSCRKLGDGLFEREMNYRLNSIRMLTSEEELCQEKLSKLMDRLIKTNSKKKAENALKLLVQSEEEIYKTENDLIEIKRQMDILSPRAIEMGFREECEKNASQIREQLTALKIKHLFETSFETFKCDDILEGQVQEIEDWARARNRVSECRQQEYEERLHLNYQRDTNKRRREKRMAIAEEKRRWQVFYYTRDGKPDKKRRPGKPWDPSVYAGAEKAVYSGAGVDLTAGSRMGKKTGLVRSVDQTLQQVTLKTYLEEVQMYEQLLNPISTIMQNTLGGGMGGPAVIHATSSSSSSTTTAIAARGGEDAEETTETQPSVSLSQRGWGLIGDSMGPALNGIGALPTEWCENRARQQRDSANVSRQSYSSYGSSVTNSARSVSSTSPQRSVRNMNRKKASHGVNGAYFGQSSSSASGQVIVAPLPMASGAKNNNNSNNSNNKNSGDFGSVEEFTSVNDMFARSSRVRRRKKKVSFLPDKESFSSSYRNNVRSISTTNQMDLYAHFLGTSSIHRTDDDDKQYFGDVLVNSTANSPRGIQQQSHHQHSQQHQQSLYGSQSAGQLNRRQSHAQHTTAVVPPLRHMPDSTMSTPLPHKVNSSSNDTNTKQQQQQHRVTSTAVVTQQSSPGGDYSVQSDTNVSSVSSTARGTYRKKKREKAGSSIPWDLLDSLDGEKQRFNNEKAHIEFHTKL